MGLGGRRRLAFNGTLTVLFSEEADLVFLSEGCVSRAGCKSVGLRFVATCEDDFLETQPLFGSFRRFLRLLSSVFSAKDPFVVTC